MLCDSLGAFSTRSTCTSASILPWAISLPPSLKANGSNSSRPISLTFTNNDGICVQSNGGSTNHWMLSSQPAGQKRSGLHFDRNVAQPFQRHIGSRDLTLYG